LSKLFNLAETWGLRDPGTNPCRLVEKHKEKPRNRYLSGDERPACSEGARSAGIGFNQMSWSVS
jgi:hypothetical protein